MVSGWVINPPPLTPVPEESSIDEVTPALKMAVTAESGLCCCYLKVS